METAFFWRFIQIGRQFHAYRSADHAFMDYTSHRYKKDGAQLSWPRTLDFFAAHLKSGANR